MSGTELSADVLTDEDMVSAVFADVVEHTSVFGDVFSNKDVSDINNDKFDFYVTDNENDSVEVEVVEEGASVPYRKGSERPVTVNRFKLAEGYEISMEARMDSATDETAREAQEKMQRIGYSRDAIARDVAEQAIANNNQPTIGDAAGGPLTYTDMVEATTALRDTPAGDFQPDTLIVGPQGVGDILTMDEFTHATQEGDDTIRQGRIGSIVGIGDILYTSNPQAATIGSGSAYVFDRSKFGRDCSWVAPNARRNDGDFDRMIDMKMITFLLEGFTDVYPDAGIEIQS